MKTVLGYTEVEVLFAFFYHSAQVQPKSTSQEPVKGSAMFLRWVLVHQLLIKSMGDDLASVLV